MLNTVAIAQCNGTSPKAVYHVEPNISQQDSTSALPSKRHKKDSASNALLLLPPCRSLANDILTEQDGEELDRSGDSHSDQNCGVCLGEINDMKITCDQCQLTCHSSCTYTLNDSTGICITCFGISTQNYNDLKTKEKKIKKMEEDIHLREKALKDKIKEQSRHISYCEKLESKNKELERTIKTLTLRIENMEKLTSNPTDSSGLLHTEQRKHETCTSPDPTSMLSAIHDRVTQFILRQVDKQLESLNDGPQACCAVGNASSNQQQNQLDSSSTADSGAIQETESVDVIDLTQEEFPMKAQKNSPKKKQSDANSVAVDNDYIKVPKNKLLEALTGPAIYYKGKSNLSQRKHEGPKRQPHPVQNRQGRGPIPTHNHSDDKLEQRKPISTSSHHSGHSSHNASVPFLGVR